MNSGIRIVAEAKKLFFDSKAVVNDVSAKARAAMARQGAYIRTVARNSMKKRAGASAPGSPPNVHHGGLKNLIFFAWDPGKRTLVAGPLPFDEKAAPLLEFGGVAQTESGTAARHPPRPYMGPALQKSIDKFPQHWRGSVNR